MPEIGETGVAFTMVAREWRAKYAMDADGTPAKSTALKAAQALLAEYLPKLKEIPSAEITRVVCGGCGDFKVIINQPAAEHGGMVKMASWRRHIWPPRAPPTAPGGGGLLSALLCRGAAPQIPPRGRGLGIRRHHTHRLRCVLTRRHGAWSEAKFAPEEEFIAKLKAIDGIERVETQEFTMERL